MRRKPVFIKKKLEIILKKVKLRLFNLTIKNKYCPPNIFLEKKEPLKIFLNVFNKK